MEGKCHGDGEGNDMEMGNNVEMGRGMLSEWGKIAREWQGEMTWELRRVMTWDVEENDVEVENRNAIGNGEEML